jgi:dynein light chain roadblock-type
MSAPTPTAESLALLARLSSKPGVQSTLVLDRANGSILRSSGLLARSRKERPSSTGGDGAWATGAAGAGSGGGEEGTPVLPGTPAKRNGTVAESSPQKEEPVQGDEGRSGMEVARTVWRFVQAAGTLVDDLDGEDELKLLRVRTRKNELVIVPSESTVYLWREGWPDAKWLQMRGSCLLSCMIRRWLETAGKDI